jgi:hypothetical protein
MTLIKLLTEGNTKSEQFANMDFAYWDATYVA